MGNFEKLSVLVIVVIIVMILVVALYTWSDKPDGTATTDNSGGATVVGSAGDHTPDPTADEPIVDPNEDVELQRSSSEGADDEEGESVPLGHVADEEGNEGGEGEDPLYRTDEEPTDVAPVSNEPWVYVMQRGDVLSKVCNRELGGYYKILPELKRLNPGVDFDRLSEGQKITMPPKGQANVSPDSTGPTPGVAPVVAHAGSAKPGAEYVVQKNESLRDIAKRVYGDWKVWVKIYATNYTAIPDPKYVRPGTRLQLPPR